MSEVKRGDRVRLTFEGIVNSENPTYVQIDDDQHRWALEFRRNRGVTIEKIEPPVEVFKPGDVVRDKRAPEYLFAIGKGGYLSISEGQWWPDSAGDTPWDSEHFERVAIE